MRIGVDCRLWNESGVGRYTRNLVHFLQKLDRENEYVLFVLHKDVENIKSQISNLKFQIKTANIPWHTVAEQFSFPLILQKEHLDLVHFPYFSVPIFYSGKFVVTIHDLIPYHFPTGRASTLSPLFYRIKLLGYKYIIQKAANRAKRIIAVSKTVKDDVSETLHIAKEKITVIYEGVGELSDVKAEKTEIEQPYFLYVGNAYPHKNLERLIEAFRKVQLDHPKVILVMVGKEDFFYKKIAGEITRLKLEGHVKLFGYATEGQLKYLYQNAKALVISSLSEGFGLPALEAMANNCLVVASDIAALYEICKDAACYFDPKDISSIVNALEQVLKSDFTIQKKLGLSRSKNFSFEKMTRQTLAIYTAAVA